MATSKGDDYEDMEQCCEQASAVRCRPVMLAASVAQVSSSGLPQTLLGLLPGASLSSMFCIPGRLLPGLEQFRPRFDPARRSTHSSSRGFSELIELITAGSKMLQCDWDWWRTARLNTYIL